MEKPLDGCNCLSYNTVIHMAPSRRLAAFRIDDDQIEGLERIAQEQDRSVSYLIRLAIREWLERQGAMKKKTERKRVAPRKRP